MTSATRIAGIAAGALLVAIPGVAQAAGGISLDAAKSAMLGTSEAKSLGVPDDLHHEFAYYRGTASPVDGIWLCDLMDEDEEIEIRGARHLYSTEYLGPTQPEHQADQEIHAYGSVDRAREIEKKVKSGARKCTGTFTHTSGPYTIRVKLSNGRGKAADGSTFVWVRTETLTKDSKTSWAEHDYAVFQRSGRFIQMLGIDSEGRDAKPLSSKQISRVDALGPALLARWVSTVG